MLYCKWYSCCCCYNKDFSTHIHTHTTSFEYSLPDATMVTMIDEEVLELWTSTVAKTPIIKPAIGFCKRLLSENAEPIN